jgi:hypothetical protein
LPPSNQQRKAYLKEKHLLIAQSICSFLVATTSSQMKEKSTDHQSPPVQTHDMFPSKIKQKKMMLSLCSLSPPPHAPS